VEAANEAQDETSSLKVDASFGTSATLTSCSAGL
jgi:hypothetical protein